ncbi:hypothetical protein J921_0091 [Acinetobacter baumannii 25493_8]|uniref:Uncharacterized protein n=1 Tax=Acinetobacter baumannii (strain ATCC 19606 / DSM 30007 / JCM 6841 / CCUG 19606 / CIP 70.34 / NBRC 109757 / NCIMB 12457 / NCTC 12156 / 81) TaxID=575584 RepID=D0C9Q6_ACIB2|nr:hypothetical protein A1S_3575 [Acinetobacter baumannii ATCC 17978]AVI37973.1 hypothetical protein CSB68_2686 [Acinetobacter baumannii]EEX03975.1 hypothetical protein HMPREF0010_01369 [Acinetobacter baumannii ATCC 19606 = CIP 70.34 = JCM 6841]EJG22012.1 hypothetical protein ACIN5143_A1529 [Acinetobacter baumannii OIFC143]EJP51527.1 hypothetical protein ACINNAV18_1059 [Acinetobacter baumannii Naval-18]EKP38833.1 hypothetical protein ACIN5087_0903 [Acinetobacter baumannii OIFC087]ETP85910.1 h
MDNIDQVNRIKLYNNIEEPYVNNNCKESCTFFVRTGA